ncbi:hypothetical protein [Cyanobacterium aponinum]|uniref:hypothetical protein n=1 Tax=Cyanobacterium aponinum TaxID=379064 RepID=UPI000C12E0D6|nr:hypothetical protein [Cyanobacterium aponinum]PHV62376.1 hypothetical protein CSQ80_11030 [Cyanobacterium aponinum IPPAS B-1201]
MKLDKINFQVIQIVAVLIGGVLVASPFIARIIERSHYQSLATEIVDYIEGIREQGNCQVNVQQGEISSNCADAFTLPEHIVIDKPLKLNYNNKILLADELLIISSRNYPEQYCIGFNGLLTRAGYYDGRCNNLENDR